MSSPFQKSFCGKSPLNQISPTGTPGNVGYYDPEYEAHPSEKLPTRRENQAELDAAKFGLSQAAEIRKTRLTPTTAKQAYDLSKPYFDADSKMRKQKRQDYSDVLEAGKTIVKSSALNQNKEKKQYQDSIQKLHKPAHDAYVKRQVEGYSISDDDGQTFNQIPPQTDPTKIKNLKDFAYTMEIGKGGSVKKDGVAASKLARMYK